jgi:putative flavoprotein involved in K+ transport
MPRHHRGRDSFHWQTETGAFDLLREQAQPAALAATLPQISGASDGSISYQQLARDGATLLGRTLGWDRRKLRLAPDPGENVRFADQVSQGMRATWDVHAGVRNGEPPWADDPADAPAPELYDLCAPESLDLAATGISTVIWATGFDASVGWLPAGSIAEYGRARLPGLHAVGASWLTHRASNNLYGIPTDASRIAAELTRRRLPAAA